VDEGGAVTSDGGSVGDGVTERWMSLYNEDLTTDQSDRLVTSSDSSLDRLTSSSSFLENGRLLVNTVIHIYGLDV